MKLETQQCGAFLCRYLSCGAWAGKLFCLVMIINYLLWRLLEFLQVICIYVSFLFLFEISWNPYYRFLPQPAEGIEEVPDIGPLHGHLDLSGNFCEPQGN